MELSVTGAQPRGGVPEAPTEALPPRHGDRKTLECCAFAPLFDGRAVASSAAVTRELDPVAV